MTKNEHQRAPERDPSRRHEFGYGLGSRCPDGVAECKHIECYQSQRCWAGRHPTGVAAGPDPTSHAGEMDDLDKILERAERLVLGRAAIEDGDGIPRFLRRAVEEPVVYARLKPCPTPQITEAVRELVGIVDYLASIVERLAKQVPDDRDIPIARDVAIRAGRLRVSLERAPQRREAAVLPEDGQGG